jgi:integrase
LAEYRRIVAVELMPRWRNRPVASITRGDVFAILDPIFKRDSRIMTNRVQQMIVALLNVAVDRGWVATNIARGIRRVGGKERRRDRALTIQEVARLWNVLGREVKPATERALQFLILTAARKSEVLGLRFDELDFDNAIWHLPAARSKGHRDHDIPLAHPTTERGLRAMITGRLCGPSVRRSRKFSPKLRL